MPMPDLPTELDYTALQGRVHRLIEKGIELSVDGSRDGDGVEIVVVLGGLPETRYHLSGAAFLPLLEEACREHQDDPSLAPKVIALVAHVARLWPRTEGDATWNGLAWVPNGDRRTV